MDIEKFIMDIKFNLMRTHYWYAGVLMQMPVVYDDPDVDTFAVGKRRPGDSLISLFVSSDYVKKIAAICRGDRTKQLQHFTEILKHEVHHLVFSHLTLDLPDAERKMIACELSANSYVDRKHLIPEEPGTLPGVFPEDYGFKSRLGANEYYVLLQHHLNPKSNSAKNTPEQSETGRNGQREDGQNRSLDSHGKWAEEGNGQMTEIIIQGMIRSANQAVRAAVNDPRLVFGNMPAELQTAIQAFDKDEPPIVPWEIILKNFLASASETVLDYTMRRPSKRYGTRPGTRKEDILSIAIGIDTSGSISQDMIQLFFKELYWVEKTGSTMTVFEWDAKVQREYDFRNFDGCVQGGGGTDPTDFLETVSRRNYDCALIFTDLGFAPIEKDYRLPMLWIDVSGFAHADNFPVQGTILKVNAARDGFELVRK